MYEPLRPFGHLDSLHTFSRITKTLVGITVIWRSCSHAAPFQRRRHPREVDLTLPLAPLMVCLEILLYASSVLFGFLLHVGHVRPHLAHLLHHVGHEVVLYLLHLTRSYSTRRRPLGSEVGLRMRSGDS